MLQKGNKTIYTMLLLSFMIIGSMLLVYGCGSDSTTNATSDPNVVKYDSVDAYPGGKNSINLYTGQTVSSSDSTKDLSVVVNGITGYKIQSGSVIAPGSNTLFTLVDTNDTKATFDAISTVAAWGTTINPSTFTLTQTGNVSVGQVYGFYLQGKSANGTLTTKTFGIFRINSIATGGLVLPKVNINVKFNKSGANKFN